MADEGIRLLLVGAAADELRAAARMARATGAEVAMAETPAEALAILRRTSVGLVMIDVHADVARFIAQLGLERFPVPVLACGIHASAERAVAAIRAGARDYVPLPPEPDLIAAVLAHAAAAPARELVAEDPATLSAMDYARAIAPGRMPVLLLGEAGVGKAILAAAIHAASGCMGHFVTVECAGVSPEIIESELFGHAAGAFAGVAAARVGKCEQAAGGTLFVRDIDRMPAGAQARLAAMLDQRSELRLIASSSRDLTERMREGGFRSDLLSRLAAVRITLPPLRERGGDVALLAEHLAERVARTHGLNARKFDGTALALLGAHVWPGNIRELEDVIHRAMVIARGPAITPEDLVLVDGTRLAARAAVATPGEARVDALVGRALEDVERALILKTLERCRGNRTSASGILGISVRTMRNKLKTFVEAGIAVAPAF
ncbi:sigma-54-dependent transcriptional regulator [Sphingomonas sp.]|jgi:DNA-binding NtrC family response regulator|uniref:sigma-54-dependent transcriptional regulator n=1 Tax=Sphingomonas sp. TaxID=28214 RepID=UPI002EDB7AC5